MADKLEKDLLAQDAISINSDFVRMLDATGVSYKNPLEDVAEVIIEDYISVIGGGNQSVKDAIDYIATCSVTLDELAELKARLGI